MLNKDIQIISDEILSYKQSICALDDKVNFMRFLDSVDNSIKKSVRINCEEVLHEKRQLEKNLRKLLDKKLKLINQQKTICNNANKTLKTDKYHSTLCNFMNEFHVQGYKNNQNAG